MNEDFIRNRITQLRQRKNISESQMSFDLGHSRNYVQGITSGKSLPSISEFLKMCDYFNLTPSEFFDEELKDPEIIKTLLSKAKKLNTEDILMLIMFIDRLIELLQTKEL